MSNDGTYSELLFRRQDVSVLAYKDDESPKPNIIVDYEGLEVTIFTSPADNKVVVQVEPVNKKQRENLRVQVEETALFRGTVNNISNPAEPTNFTVLFDDGQTHKKEN